jgi:hypothetical protein
LSRADYDRYETKVQQSLPQKGTEENSHQKAQKAQNRTSNHFQPYGPFYGDIFFGVAVAVDM